MPKNETLTLAATLVRAAGPGHPDYELLVLCAEIVELSDAASTAWRAGSRVLRQSRHRPESNRERVVREGHWHRSSIALKEAKVLAAQANRQPVKTLAGCLAVALAAISHRDLNQFLGRRLINAVAGLPEIREAMWPEVHSVANMKRLDR